MRLQFADLGDPIGQLTHDGMITWRQLGDRGQL
jgi:hypothetical protein